MKANYAKILSLVLQHEGGFVNHKDDPGGPTNRGVTQRVYDAYRARNRQPARSVKHITDDELQAIYRFQYWDAVKGDDLPSGIDFAVFDFAVNSGPARAIRYLQMVLGVTVDSNIGQVTLKAAADAVPKSVIVDLCDKRLTFLRNLDTWATFGKGWKSRVDGVRKKALEMASGTPVAAPAPTPVAPPPPDVEPVPAPSAEPTEGARIAKWVVGIVGALAAAFAAWMMKG